ncbi:hypothetical protein U1Q18_010776 [Sarracenia purpurea var. burkii]
MEPSGHAHHVFDVLSKSSSKAQIKGATVHAHKVLDGMPQPSPTVVGASSVGRGSGSDPRRAGASGVRGAGVSSARGGGGSGIRGAGAVVLVVQRRVVQGELQQVLLGWAEWNGWKSSKQININRQFSIFK